MSDVVLDYLNSIVSKEQIHVKESLAGHTTFRVGGLADYFVEIAGDEELKHILLFLKEKEIPYFILGNGSNLLVGDGGFRGVILHLGDQFSDITIEGERVVAKAGAILSKVANLAAKESLTGMEFASGIPGTIGGAIVMNAGAYDGEMEKIVESVRVMDEQGEIRTLRHDDMHFAYRHSVIKEQPYVVLSVTLKLEKGNTEAIKEKIADFAARRRSKQPLEFPSAGSTFKRPEGHFAGKLIMDAGLRGYQVGGAQVSEKHCGFVINAGNATAKDVDILMKDVAKIVFDKFEVPLEPEVIRVGEFS